MKKDFAFTLAEVLITLAIIGVVAAMTIPTLVANYQEKSWNTAASVFNRKLGEALKVMNSQSALAGFATTRDFVDELSKHIKIIKTCNSNELDICFASDFSTNEKTYKIEELKQEIENIKERNKKVELDKKWETSWTRKICICILTYIVVISYSYMVRNYDNIFLSSLVPVIGFTLSTLSLKYIRSNWEKKIK